MSRNVLALFLLIVPLAAAAASAIIMNMYGKGNDIEASMDGTPSNSVTAFKYNNDIESKKIYRIVLRKTDSFEEAEAYVGSMKEKKLNVFKLKEDGYKVIYGAFTDNDEAGKVLDRIAEIAEGSISELSLAGYSLKYNDSDSTFIQLVQAADQLVWEIMKAKSMITCGIALNSVNNPDLVLAEISENEDRLKRYLGYAQELKVSDSQKIFRENFSKMLKDLLEHRLEIEIDKDYYAVQESLLNQIEAYRKFIEKLSV